MAFLTSILRNCGNKSVCVKYRRVRNLRSLQVNSDFYTWDGDGLRFYCPVYTVLNALLLGRNGDTLQDKSITWALRLAEKGSLVKWVLATQENSEKKISKFTPKTRQLFLQAVVCVVTSQRIHTQRTFWLPFSKTETARATTTSVGGLQQVVSG